MNIFEKITFLLTPKEDVKLFKGGETIDIKLSEHLKKYPKAGVSKLFQGDKFYQLEYNCCICKKKSLHSNISKTKLVDLLHTKSIECDVCLFEKEQLRKEKLKKENILYEQKTDLFIEDFLCPNNKFNSDVPKKDYYNIIVKKMIGLNTEKIFKYAAKMPYYDFLNTPYWAAVRYKVMQKAGFKCSLCNEKGKLAVHHRSYEYRGYEIQTQKDLICLCNDCHEKFHDI